jgi:hypothetical protein
MLGRRLPPPAPSPFATSSGRSRSTCLARALQYVRRDFLGDSREGLLMHEHEQVGRGEIKKEAAAGGAEKRAGPAGVRDARM